MGEFNYYSQQAMTVATEEIREEAKAWHDHSVAMDGVRTSMAGFGLSMSAFSVIDPMTLPAAVDLSNAYTATFNKVLGLMSEASTEFRNFGESLKRAADWYEDSDENSVVRIDSIYH
jgi:hypothetical protein